MELCFWKEEGRKGRKTDRCWEDREKQQANYMGAENHWERGYHGNKWMGTEKERDRERKRNKEREHEREREKEREREL